MLKYARIIIFFLLPITLASFEPQEQEDFEESSEILGVEHIYGIEVTRIRIEGQVYRVSESPKLIIFREIAPPMNQTLIVDPQLIRNILKIYHRKLSPRKFH